MTKAHIYIFGSGLVNSLGLLDAPAAPALFAAAMALLVMGVAEHWGKRS